MLRPSLDLAVVCVLFAAGREDEIEVAGRFDLAGFASRVLPFDLVGVKGC